MEVIHVRNLQTKLVMSSWTCMSYAMQEIERLIAFGYEVYFETQLIIPDYALLNEPYVL